MRSTLPPNVALLLNPKMVNVIFLHFLWLFYREEQKRFDLIDFSPRASRDRTNWSDVGNFLNSWVIRNTSCTITLNFSFWQTGTQKTTPESTYACLFHFQESCYRNPETLVFVV
jgi:hypothetical protein